MEKLRCYYETDVCFKLTYGELIIEQEQIVERLQQDIEQLTQRCIEFPEQTTVFTNQIKTLESKLTRLLPLIEGMNKDYDETESCSDFCPLLRASKFFS